MGVFCMRYGTLACSEFTTFEHNITLPPLTACMNRCDILSNIQAVLMKWCRHEKKKEKHQSTLACRHSLPPTFFQRLANFNITVCSLKLVEEGADFEFVCGALLQLCHDGAVLSGGPDLKDFPFVSLLALWWDPVHHLVALNVLGLLLHLVKKAKMTFLSEIHFVTL